MRPFPVLLPLAFAVPAATQEPPSPRVTSALQHLAGLKLGIGTGSRRLQVESARSFGFDSLPERIGARVKESLRGTRRCSGRLTVVGSLRVARGLNRALDDSLRAFSWANALGISAEDL